MISIDRQPWAHRAAPAFVTSELKPIADSCHLLMNWPCSASLFNWWCAPFQVNRPGIFLFSFSKMYFYKAPFKTMSKLGFGSKMDEKCILFVCFNSLKVSRVKGKCQQEFLMFQKGELWKGKSFWWFFPLKLIIKASCYLHKQLHSRYHTVNVHRAKVHRASQALNNPYKKEFALGETTQVYTVESGVHNFVILRACMKTYTCSRSQRSSQAL